ncbi:3-hydroxyisobutyrate dehydrogenase [Rhizobium sp. AC27/96]|uniref:L-threonate dehydrogenase n=1 Tax=Rhizobium sp. AC27/96 TaxID=1841653 RepID=UPI0008290985|nr:L-threonate dehydrogenase [Rhizobium sp. AC27/96]OCJ07247.1 3-hydroxyisobutyrate dehydrogenase [Rhizobium sp. AC27/96]
MQETKKAAVIGLGSMGWGAALSLLKAGFAVRGCDIRSDALARFTEAGGDACTTPALAAETADVILVYVINSKQVEDVVFGPNGALETAKPGTVFLLCSTMAPSATTDIAERLETAGMLVIDAPVSGGHVRALAGEITVMASGSQEAFDRASAALDAISAKVFRLGDRPGAGSQVKMINQLLAGVHIAATAEAMTLAAKAGIDLKTLYDVIRVSAGSSWMFENRGEHIVSGDYAPRSAVNIFVKDLGIVASEAEKAGAITPLAASALNLFVEASEAGLGQEDDAAVAKILARKSGATLPGMEE